MDAVRLRWPNGGAGLADAWGAVKHAGPGSGMQEGGCRVGWGCSSGRRLGGDIFEVQVQ